MLSSTLDEKLGEIRERGYCVLPVHLARQSVDACRDAFQHVLSAYLAAHRESPNRGPYRHFLPMPFDPPCFAPEFFFDGDILNLVRRVMDDRIVADQWGCDVPLPGSGYQEPHVDYRRPLFPEAPDLVLPPHALVVSFALVPVTRDNGPIEIAAGTHRMPGQPGLQAVQAGEALLQPVLLEPGDVLIRHPWAVHRGSPNTTAAPRPLAGIRYVRHWYADASRDVAAIPRRVWDSLTGEQQRLLRFPVEH